MSKTANIFKRMLLWTLFCNSEILKNALCVPEAYKESLAIRVISRKGGFSAGLLQTISLDKACQSVQCWPRSTQRPPRRSTASICSDRTAHRITHQPHHFLRQGETSAATNISPVVGAFLWYSFHRAVRILTSDTFCSSPG